MAGRPLRRLRNLERLQNADLPSTLRAGVEKALVAFDGYTPTMAQSLARRIVKGRDIYTEYGMSEDYYVAEIIEAHMRSEGFKGYIDSAGPGHLFWQQD